MALLTLGLAEELIPPWLTRFQAFKTVDGFIWAPLPVQSSASVKALSSPIDKRRILGAVPGPNLVGCRGAEERWPGMGLGCLSAVLTVWRNAFPGQPPAGMKAREQDQPCGKFNMAQRRRKCVQ